MVEVHLTMISHETCLQNIKDARENPTDELDTLDGNTFCTNGDPYAVLYCVCYEQTFFCFNVPLIFLIKKLFTLCMF